MVTQTESQLGGLDDAMHHCAFAFAGQGQAIGQTEDRQRHQALSGWGEVEDFTFLMLKSQRRAPTRPIIRQILGGERHAQPGHIGRHALRQSAAIEAVQPLFGQGNQGIR
ncbi:hypothetical protein D3C80_1078640 [compost metagenome]